MCGNKQLGILAPFTLFWTSGDICPGFQSQSGSLVCFLACMILRFTSGVTPADCIEVSMVAEPFEYMHLQTYLQALVEVLARPGLKATIVHAAGSKHSTVNHSATPASVFISVFITLVDPGGPGGPGSPWPPDLEAPVIQFGGPVYNLRAKQLILGPFFYIFSKKFLASLCSASVSHFIFFYSHHFIIHLLMCILPHHIDWSKVFLHKNVWELINILNKICLKVQQRSLGIVEKYIFWDQKL